MAQPLVEVTGLSKQYRLDGARTPYPTLRGALTDAVSGLVRKQPSAPAEGFWALRDVSFGLTAGEVVGVVGRNGAGKTTLLKLLSRITEPTAGRIVLRGRVASLLEVGTGFHPELTGFENIYLNGAILGMRRTEIARKFDEIVAFAEVERHLHTPVKRYSSGMYVRLAFAVAAHLQPEILLMDEVLSVGDMAFQKKCIGRMEQVSGEGNLVIIVSHSMTTIKAICTRAMLLDGGQVRNFGSVDSIVDQYMAINRAATAQVSFSVSSTEPGRLHVLEARLEKPVNNQFTVYWKQPIEVALRVLAPSEIDDVTFGAGIRLADGTYVFMAYSTEAGESPWRFGSGESTVRFSLQNDLKPGIYTLHVAAYRRYASIHNLLSMDAATLEVLDIGESGGVAPSVHVGLLSGIPASFGHDK